jgi:phosphomannomutase/phosphomannomutase/phosphoglucomutase
MDGGIVVTASHNPKDYNGMKFVREDSKPISGDTGLTKIKQLAEANNFSNAAVKGSVTPLEHRSAYLKHLLDYINHDNLKPLKIVVNAGNGGAGAVIDELEKLLPFEFIKVHHEADGNFPNGVPNPLLVENRPVTIEAIKQHGADLGVAWDGDFVEGYYIVGLLAEAFLQKYPGGKVVHDPRLTWNTMDIVSSLGGTSVRSKTGHAFIKERMRLEDAVYGGEMSAHHYFRDFAYCDSGMIPWLLIAELVSVKDQGLSQLLADRMARFPASGEINRRIEDPQQVLANIESVFQDGLVEKDLTDGLSMDFDQWRFNVRLSNTEPVMRLNVESRGDVELMKRKTTQILEMMAGEPA